MSEAQDDGSTVDPMAAARRGARPALRRRFYQAATVTASPDGYAITLDGKPVHTPARRALRAPDASLAAALAQEWQAQGEAIDPSRMPLTRLVNVIIDGV